MRTGPCLACGHRPAADAGGLCNPCYDHLAEMSGEQAGDAFPDELPSWQPDLFGGPAKSVAAQGTLFDVEEPAPAGKPRVKILPGQQPLF